MAALIAATVSGAMVSSGLVWLELAGVNGDVVSKTSIRRCNPTSFLDTAKSATVTTSNRTVLKSIRLVRDSARATVWTAENNGLNMG